MFGSKKKTLIEADNIIEEATIIEEKNNNISQKEYNLMMDRIQKLEQDLSEKQNTIDKLKKEKEEILYNIEHSYLKDKGYQTLLGFKLIPPFLDKIIGRPFTITVSEEFNYKTNKDKEEVNRREAEIRALEGPSFHNFRDEFRKDHSIRVTYFYASKDYYMDTPKGKIKMKDFILPDVLESGVEISSQFNSAMYLCIKTRNLQSAVLPQKVFGAPLLSYAFPIFDEKGVPIGGVSFSNDISKIVHVAQGLGEVVSNQDDKILQNLADILKQELDFTQVASKNLKSEAVFSQKTSEIIKKSGLEIIQIAERLKVLALNTAIESTKVGATGRGVGIIAKQMKNISEVTSKTLKEISSQSEKLSDSSNKVFKTSDQLENSSRKLQEESSVLFKTSNNITNQKDELASLVKISLGEITQSQDDLKAIFTLIQKENKH